MRCVLAAMTMQLYMHKISSKPSFILPRSIKLLWFYVNSRKPVRSLSRMRYRVTFLSSEFTGEVSLKMSINALGICIKLWYGLKYGILNTQKNSSQ